MRISQKSNVIIIVGCVIAGLNIFCSNENTSTNPTPVLLEIWKGVIMNDTVPFLGAVNHDFTYSLWSDDKYGAVDTLTAHASGLKIGTNIETGTWAKTSAMYIFYKDSCVGSDGQMKPENCSGIPDTALINGVNIVITDYKDTLDLIMAEQ